MSGLRVSIRQKRFAPHDGPVLSGLELSAADGEILVVVGPSGAGKTTLLNIVAGLDPEYEGEVHGPGAPAPAAPGAARRIGYMFQSPRLMPWLSVLDNVLLVLDDSADSRGLACRLLEQVGLREYADAYPHQLSGGMQRRVALARAFSVHPELMLLDEPFVSLDAPTIARLGEALMRLWSAERPTILFVTHSLREALFFGDRVVFLSHRPARVVLDTRVDLPRPRHFESPPIMALHDRLLAEHPDLLSGLAKDCARTED